MVRGLICRALLEKMEKYHLHLILDLSYLIEDFSKYKNIVSRLIKGDVDCYPFYMNDIENIIKRIEGEEVDEVNEVNIKENYDCLRTTDKYKAYYDYLISLSNRLVKIYNTYKSVEDELNPNHSFMNDIQDILDRINKRKEVYNNQLKNAARLRSPLNRLSNASSKKSWWGSKTRRAKKNRSTRKRK